MYIISLYIAKNGNEWKQKDESVSWLHRRYNYNDPLVVYIFFVWFYVRFIEMCVRAYERAGPGDTALYKYL